MVTNPMNDNYDRGKNLRRKFVLDREQDRSFLTFPCMKISLPPPPFVCRLKFRDGNKLRFSREEFFLILAFQTRETF